MYVLPLAGAFRREPPALFKSGPGKIQVDRALSLPETAGRYRLAFWPRDVVVRSFSSTHFCPISLSS